MQGMRGRARGMQHVMHIHARLANPQAWLSHSTVITRLEFRTFGRRSVLSQTALKVVDSASTLRQHGSPDANSLPSRELGLQGT